MNFKYLESDPCMTNGYTLEIIDALIGTWKNKIQIQ
jgi:hypothetical protein